LGPGCLQLPAWEQVLQRLPPADLVSVRASCKQLRAAVAQSEFSLPLCFPWKAHQLQKLSRILRFNQVEKKGC
jgi:hypothetical protein